MAIAFSLTPKGETEPAVLQEVDDQMRLAFHVEPDKVNWYRHWYDLIGLAMAFGKDKTEILALFPDHKDIIDWLYEHYTVESYRL